MNQFHNGQSQPRQGGRLENMRRKFNKFRNQVQTWSYRVKRILGILLIIFMISSSLLVLFEGKLIWFAVTHQRDIGVLKSIDQDVKEEMLAAALRLEARLEKEKKEEINKQFGKVTMKGFGNPLGITEVAAAEEDSIVEREVRAYNSEVGQTDGSPCKASLGHNICELYEKYDHKGIRIMAAGRNAAQLGDVLEIEGLRGIRGIVMDRMPDYNVRGEDQRGWLDVFHKDDKAGAKRFGVQHLEVRKVGHIDPEDWENIESLYPEISLN